MDAERFKALAEAYGGDIACWPAAARASAIAMAARDADMAALLARETAIDHALDAWTVPAPSMSLRETVLAGAPKLRRAFLAEVRSGLGFWLSGAGLATACAAGLLCGAAGSYAVNRDARDAALVASATPDVASTAIDASEAQRL